MGTNRYAYSANDPVNKSDPNGHAWFNEAWDNFFGSGSFDRTFGDGASEYADKFADNFVDGYRNGAGGLPGTNNVPVLGDLVPDPEATVDGIKELADGIKKGQPSSIFIGVATVATKGKLKKGADSVTKLPESLNLGSNFGKKIGKRFKELGLDPTKPKLRHQFKQRVNRIFSKAEEIKIGNFRGQDGNVIFYRNGRDVVLTKPDGELITILTNGSENKRFVEAIPWAN